jgi:hypothetical protein
VHCSLYWDVHIQGPCGHGNETKADVVFPCVQHPQHYGRREAAASFYEEIGSIFDCVLVAPQEGKLAGLARRFGIQVKICNLPMLHGVYTPYRGIADDAEHLRHTPAYQEVVSLIRETAPDMVLTNTCVNVMPAVAAKSLQIPVIWKITEIIHSNEHTTEQSR